MKPTKIFFLFFLIMASNFAAALTQQTNASDFTNIVYSGGWKNSTYTTDDDFNSYGHTLPGDAGTLSFIVPGVPGFTSALMLSKSADDTPISSTIPAGCYRGGKINISVISSYDAVNDCIFLKCWNGTGLQTIYQNGAGDSSCTRFYELYVNYTFTGVSSCPAAPTPPMYREDDFSYDDSINSCYWSVNPDEEVYPDSGQLCYNMTSGQDPVYFFFTRAANVQSSVWSEEFDITLPNDGAFISHEFILYNSNFQGYPALNLLFDGLGIYGTQSGYNYTIKTICSNCTTPGESTHIKIVVYTAQSSGETIFNASSGQMQAVNPNSYAVQVDSGDWVFNIPLSFDTTGYDIPYSSEFLSILSGFCLDNFELYGGSVYVPGSNQTGTPPANSLRLGEKCDNDIQCISQFCNYIRECDLKNFGASCTNGYECLSGICSYGKCTKASLSQTGNKIRDDVVGTDQQSHNILSLFLCLFFAIMVIVAGSIVGAGAEMFIAAGGAFGLGLILFTAWGWLHPFFLIGYLILVVGLAFIIFSSKGG